MKKQTILAVMALILTASLALFAGAVTLDSAEPNADASLQSPAVLDYRTFYVDANSVYTLVEGEIVTDIDLGNSKAIYDEETGTITGTGYAGTVIVTTQDSGTIEINFRGATKWLPGLNILTGTTASYDGETEKSAELTFTTDKTGTTRGNFQVDKDPSNEANTVIQLTKSSGQASMTIYTKNSFETIPNERPVQVAVDYINPGFDSYCLINGTTGTQYKTLGLTKNTNGSWERKSVGKGTALKTDKDMTSIGLQFGPKDETVTAPVYIDNIAYIPYYKITYNFENGSTQDDYVLYDSNAKLLTEYTIPENITDSSDGLVFVGWTDTYGGSEALEKVSLNYADVSLYPVFKNASLMDNAETAIAADGFIIVDVLDKNADITWTLDAGNTGATFNEDTYRVTGAGYAGTVKLTASCGDVSETKIIHLIGTSKWKPGLNILTSSTSAFELSQNGSVAAEQFALMFANDARASVRSTIDPLDPSGYPVMYFEPASGQSNPYMYFSGTLSPVIEKARPVEISYRFHGTGSVWFMTNARSGDDILKISGKNFEAAASASAWTNGSGTVTGSTTANGKDVSNFGFVGNMGTNSGKYAAFSNLLYIPYYKVTYIGLDGETVAATEYVLRDTNGNLLTEYTLTRPVEGATSYYLDKALTNQVENDKIALANEDIVIYASVKNEVVYSVDGTVVTKEYTSENVTIAKPSETDASLSDTNFVVWVDADGNKYYVGETVAAADLAGKTLTAYLQDATKPAVGYAYNGNYAPAYEKAGYRYTELIEDEGRDVLHIHLWNGMDGNGTTFPTDWRASFRLNNANNTYTHYDPAEYNLVQYITKIPAAYQNSNGKPVAANAVNLRMYAQTSNGGVYTSPVIGITKSNIPVKDEYVAYLFDYSSDANYLAKAGYGFCVDYIHNATYGGDAYIDSLVVYRKGIFTVTYNTNAPEGATVVKNVEADTNRGVGTGYILKDIRPEIGGYVFKGWATTPDATVSDVVTAIDLKGDTTVYAVWEANTNYKTTVSEGKVEIKDFGTTNGIRFHTSTSNAVKACVNELGFLATRETLLTSANDYTELTFDFKHDNVSSADAAPKYSSGVAYIKNEKDIIFREGDNGEIIYTAMVKGIPTAYKNEKLVVRPYAKYLVNGKEVTVYGEAMSASLVDVATAVKAEKSEAYANNAEYIDSIVG